MDGRKRNIIFHIICIVIVVSLSAYLWGNKAREAADYQLTIRQLREGNKELTRQLEKSQLSVDRITAGIENAQERIKDSIESVNSIQGIINAIRKAISELDKLMEI